MAALYSQNGILIRNKSSINCSSIFKGIVQYDSINKLITCDISTGLSYMTSTGLDFGNQVNENFVIQLRFKYSSSPEDYIAFIGVGVGSNYQNIAFHYRKSNHTYWIGVPNSNNTSWQHIINWKKYEFSPDTWYTIKLEFNNFTRALKVYINNSLDASGIIEDPTKFNNTISFGANFDGKYSVNMTIDTSETYISIGNKLAWKFDP